MPQHAALASAVGAMRADLRQQCADAEELLVARHDLADLAVEQHKTAQHLQQPVRGEQPCQQQVLLSGQHGLGPQRLAVGPQRRRLACQQGIARGRRQWQVLELAQLRLVELLVAPARPEFGRGVRCAVARLGQADGQ